MTKKPEISKDYVDSQYPNAAEFVAPLINNLSKLKIEKIDLTTVEGANEAILQMAELKENIAKYQNQVRGLKAILEKQKLDSNDN